MVSEGVQESGHYRLLSIVCCCVYRRSMARRCQCRSGRARNALWMLTVFVRGLSSGEHL